MSRWNAVSDYDYAEETGNPVPRMERSRKLPDIGPALDAELQARDHARRWADPGCPDCKGRGWLGRQACGCVRKDEEQN